jgi:hypothetical protein
MFNSKYKSCDAPPASRPDTRGDEEHPVAEEAGALGPTAFAALGALQSRAPIEGPRFAAAARAFMQATLAGVVRAIRRAVAPTAAAVPEEVQITVTRASVGSLLDAVTARCVCRPCCCFVMRQTPHDSGSHDTKQRRARVQDYSVADAQLFRVLGRPRPDDDARGLLAQSSIAIAV